MLDEAAFEHNWALMKEHVAAQAGLKIRIASKSLRCAPLIKRLVETDPEGRAISGVMAFRVAEAAHLHRNAEVNDILIAYPVASRVEASALAELEKSAVSKGGAASIVVDCREHVDILVQAGKKTGVEIPLVIEIDLAYRPSGSHGPHLGARRSPLYQPSEIRALAEYIRECDGVRMHGLMGYEAHHAAVPDSHIHERLFKRVSAHQMEELRQRVSAALASAGFNDLPLLNGGGSGSHTTTSKSHWVNEVAVGSGLYKTALFDKHAQLAGFKPALFFALQAVRIPGPGWATAFGGGYYASGGGMAPVVHSPEGLQPTKAEGFGEVQTPLKDRGRKLKIGDLVICRPSKAGEPLERFNQLYTWRDGKLGEPLATYRGEGVNFG